MITIVVPIVGAAVGLLAPAAPALGLQALGLGVQTLFRRDRPSTKITPGKIVQAAVITDELRKQGLEGRLGVDPFTGGVSISTPDQAPILQQLLLESAVRALPVPPQVRIPSLPTLENRQRVLEQVLVGGLPPPTEAAPLPLPALPETTTVAQLEAAGIPIPPGAIGGTTVMANGTVTKTVDTRLLETLSGPCAAATTVAARAFCAATSPPSRF